MTHFGFDSQMATLAVLWKTDFGRGEGRSRELVQRPFWFSGQGMSAAQVSVVLRRGEMQSQRAYLEVRANGNC